MADRKTTLLVWCVATLAASSTVFAQRWGRENFPRDGVCFFKDPGFRGEYFCARSGDSLSAVPDDMNDRISSIRIFGRAEVTVFRDVRFSGRSARFETDVRNLKDEGWNDLISSLRVRSGSFGRLAEDPDRIIRRAYEDILDREPDTAGLRLYRSRMIDDGWSEAKVREALRKSPEYREKSTMTPAKAQDIVRRAYLAVLTREPDSASQGYVDKVLRDRWSQQDVERELRKSDEYRNKRP
jgi:plasmid stability protein